VTWLYGPLQTCRKQLVSNSCLKSRDSSSDKVLNKKPILRTRTASEIILQRLQTQHSLSGAIGPISRAREIQPSPDLSRDAQEAVIHRVDSGLGIADSLDNNPRSSDRVLFPKNRSVRFNDEVLQWIAVEGKDCEEDNDAQWLPFPFDPDNDSDDDVLMMKPLPSKETYPQ
jgi:hypothetical protein